jgi:hypothetical protein
MRRACTVAARVLDCVCGVDWMLGDHCSDVLRNVQKSGWVKLRYLSRGVQRGYSAWIYCWYSVFTLVMAKKAVVETHQGRSHRVKLQTVAQPTG